jgi:type VI secretion system (T6SS) baseplate-like injector VgrG
VNAYRAVSAIRRIARYELAQRWTTTLGVVRSVYGSDTVDKQYACTVELRDTGLVLPKVPIATGTIGTAALPREKDLVVVTFVGGDLHSPVVVGRLYNELVAPPANAPGEVVVCLPADQDSADQRVDLRVVTPGDGTRALTLVLDGPVKVAVEIKDDGVTIRAGNGSLKLTQSTASDARAEIKVGEAVLSLAQNGNVTIDTSGTLKLHGAEVEIDGDVSVKVSGTTIDLN